MEQKKKSWIPFTKMKIFYRYEDDEPNSCEFTGCQDCLNGLHHYWILLAVDYCFDIWLCSKHAEEFERRVKIVQKSLGTYEIVKVKK